MLFKNSKVFAKYYGSPIFFGFCINSLEKSDLLKNFLTHFVAPTISTTPRTQKRRLFGLQNGLKSSSRDLIFAKRFINHSKNIL